jgi:hypothetical protein
MGEGVVETGDVGDRVVAVVAEFVGMVDGDAVEVRAGVKAELGFTVA